MALHEGEWARARQFAREGYAVFKEDKAELGFLLTLRTLAHLHQAEGNWITVARILGALKANPVAQVAGFHYSQDERENTAQAALGAEEFEAQSQIGARLSWQQAVEMAL